MATIRAASAFCAVRKLSAAIVRLTRFSARSPWIASSRSFARLYASTACSSDASSDWICASTDCACARFDETEAGSAVALPATASAAASDANTAAVCWDLLKIKRDATGLGPVCAHGPGAERHKLGTLTTVPDGRKRVIEKAVVGSPLVRAPGRGLRTLGAAVLCGVAVGVLLPTGGGAQSPADLQAQADALRERNEALSAGSQSALASLTTIESRLAQAQAELASFRSRSAQVRTKRIAAAQQLRIARGSLRASQKALAFRLRALYEQDDPDVLAAVLGAGSLDDALTALESLDQAAREDADLLGATRRASRRLKALTEA